jgi:hypothetical protein
LLVHPQAVTDALRQFESVIDLSPQGLRDFPCTLGFGSLRGVIDRHGVRDGTLADLAATECATFVLNDSKHWSILTYCRERRDLMLRGSIATMHVEAARRVHALLVWARFIPNDTVLCMMREPTTQAGDWQCGYAAIAFACVVSGELSEELARAIVENDSMLVEFIKTMLTVSRLNGEAATTDILRNHTYKFVDR